MVGALPLRSVQCSASPLGIQLLYPFARRSLTLSGIRDWWKDRFIWLTWGNYGEFTPGDIERVAREAAGKSCNLLEVVPVRGDINEEYALFRSSVLPKWEKAGDRDLLAEQVEAAHKMGLRVRTYLNAHFYGDRFYERHKDWAQVKADGSPIDTLYGHGYSMCVRTSYRERMFQLIREVAERGVDVVFLDGPAYYPGACYCDDCRNEFRSKTGEELPTREDWDNPSWRKFVLFRYHSIAEFLEDGTRTLRERGIKSLLYSNNSSQVWPSWSFALSAEDSYDGQGIIGMESYQYYTPPSGVPMWFQGWTTKLASSIKRDKPFCLFLSASHQPWFRQKIPAVEYLLGKLQGLANGADMFEDHGFATEAIPEGEKYFAMARKYEEYYQSSRSMARVAIVWSRRTGDFFYELPPRAGADEAQARVEGEKPAAIAVQAGDFLEAQRIAMRKYESERRIVEEARGFYEALMRLHVPFDLISDLNINDEELAQYDELILPNVACLSDGQVQGISDFVRSGKGLVSTYKTSMYTETGEPRGDFGLSDVFGVSSSGELMDALKWDYMVVKERHPVVEGIPAFKPYATELPLIPSPEYVLKSEGTGAESICLQLQGMPARYGDVTPETPYATVMANEVGAGRSVTFPCTFGGQYWNNGFVDYLKIIENSVRWTSGSSATVQTDAPQTVETTLFGGDGFLMLHLVNFGFELRRPFMGVFPVEGARFSVRTGRKPTSVKALYSNKSLKWSYAKGIVSFRLPKLHLYEVVLVRM